MFRFALVLLMVFLTTPAFGQGGAAFSTLKRATVAADNATNQWRDAIKLYVISRLKNQSSPHPQQQCLALDKLQVGQAGLIDCWPLRVLAVQSNGNILLSGDHAVLQLTGVDGRRLRPQQAVRVLGPIKVDGRSPNNTQTGTPTFLVHLVTEQELARPSQPAERPSSPSDTGSFVKWHSKAGTQVSAKFQGFADGKVELLTEDGRTLKLPLSVFTDEDAKRLRQLIRRSRQ